MKTVCKNDLCAGCKACISVCPKDAITIKDSLSAYNAIIDTNKCINCNLCYKVCQVNSDVELTTVSQWYQGWCLDEDIRKRSSSGGLATAITKAFIDTGGTVFTCVYRNKNFGFEKITKENFPTLTVGSKYVKSNPEGVILK